jgi:hypothetical protein
VTFQIIPQAAVQCSRLYDGNSEKVDLYGDTKQSDAIVRIPLANMEADMTFTGQFVGIQILLLEVPFC